jgi:hypothetical protein
MMRGRNQIWRGQIIEKSATYFHFAIGPSWDLNDHVQDSLLLIGIERDIVEWGDWNSIFLDVDAVLQGVWSADLANLVSRRHFCGCILTVDVVLRRRGARRDMSSYLFGAGRNFVGWCGLRQSGRRRRQTGERTSQLPMVMQGLERMAILTCWTRPEQLRNNYSLNYTAGCMTEDCMGTHTG